MITDPFQLLLKFAKQNPNLYREQWGKTFTTYGLHLQNIENSCQQLWLKHPPSFRENFWNKWHKQDQQLQAQVDEEYKNFRENALKEIKKVDDKFIFLTINFDDSTTINIKKMLTIAQSITKLRFFKSGQYVLEKHRQREGIHHHVHFLIRTHDHIKVNDVVKAIMKPKYVSDYVQGPQFIDVKIPNAKKLEKRAHDYANYEKYLTGEKQQEKMTYVELDRTWREENNIEHLYEFNNL